MGSQLDRIGSCICEVSESALHACPILFMRIFTPVSCFVSRFIVICIVW